MHGAGEEGVGEDVTYDAPDHEVAAGGRARPAAGGRVDAGLLLRPRRGARPVARAARARGLAPVPRVGLRVAALDLALRQAGTSLHAAARPRAAPGALRRLAAPGRAADPRPRGASAWSATRRCASSSTRPPSGRPRSSPAWWPRARSTRSTSRASTSARSSTRPPIPSSTGAWSRPSPTPGSRTRSSPRRPTRSSSPTATASPGTRPSTGSPTSRPSPSRRGWSTSSRRASARCARCSAPTTTATARGIGDVRRRAVRARPRPRPHPVPGVALSPRHPQRRGARRLQRPRRAGGAAGQPAGAGGARAPAFAGG